MFQNWIARSDDNIHAFCKLCYCELTARRSNLLKHMHSKRHQEEVKCQLKNNVSELRKSLGNVNKIVEECLDEPSTIISQQEETDKNNSVEDSNVMTDEKNPIEIAEHKCQIASKQTVKESLNHQ